MGKYRLCIHSVATSAEKRPPVGGSGCGRYLRVFGAIRLSMLFLDTVYLSRGRVGSYAFSYSAYSLRSDQVSRSASSQAMLDVLRGMALISEEVQHGIAC